MVNSHMLEEFIGRFGISYKDGKIIYAYDEITHGLYKFRLDSYMVDLLVPPLYIHQKITDNIKGISKIGNEIILIPFCLDSK